MIEGQRVLRLGILGARFAAALHANAAKRVASVSVDGVASLHHQNAAAFAAEHSIAWAAQTTGELLNSDQIDAVSICVPSYLHAEFAIQAAQCHKHVLCEKPMATSVDDARSIIRACAEHRVFFGYAEDWLFAPALVRAKEILDQGAIGKLLSIRARECHSGSHSSFAQKRATCGGGAMIHLGSHPVAAALWLADARPKTVLASASGGLEANLVHHQMEGEDWAVAIVELDNGVRAVIEANYITQGGRNDVIEMFGTDGYLHVDLTLGAPIRAFSKTGVAYTIEKADHNSGWSFPAVDEIYDHGFVDQLAHFADCILNDKQPKPGARAEDGLSVLQVALAAAESARAGRKVVIA